MKTDQEVLRTFEAAVRHKKGSDAKLPSGFPGFREFAKDIRAWARGLPDAIRMLGPYPPTPLKHLKRLSEALGKDPDVFEQAMVFPLDVSPGEAVDLVHRGDKMARSLRALSDLFQTGVFAAGGLRIMQVLPGYPRYIRDWEVFANEMTNYLDALVDLLGDRKSLVQQSLEEVALELAPMLKGALGPISVSGASVDVEPGEGLDWIVTVEGLSNEKAAKKLKDFQNALWMGEEVRGEDGVWPGGFDVKVGLRANPDLTVKLAISFEGSFETTPAQGFTMGPQTRHSRARLNDPPRVAATAICKELFPGGWGGFSGIDEVEFW